MVVRDAEEDAAAAMLMRAGGGPTRIGLFATSLDVARQNCPTGTCMRFSACPTSHRDGFVKAKPHLLVVRSIPDGLPNANSEALGLDKAIRAAGQARDARCAGGSHGRPAVPGCDPSGGLVPSCPSVRWK